MDFRQNPNTGKNNLRDTVYPYAPRNIPNALTLLTYSTAKVKLYELLWLDMSKVHIM